MTASNSLKRIARGPECLTGGASTSGGGGEGDFSSIETDKRFTDVFMAERNGENTSLAIGTDKNLYAWGRDLNEYLRYMRKIGTSTQAQAVAVYPLGDRINTSPTPFTHLRHDFHNIDNPDCTGGWCD